MVGTEERQDLSLGKAEVMVMVVSSLLRVLL
jgi:hypothetical protein